MGDSRLAPTGRLVASASARQSGIRFDSGGVQLPYKEDDARPIEVAAGAVVFFNGYLLHKSLRNRRTSGFRRALVNHYMSAESLLPWWRAAGPNPPTQDNRDIVLVAGADPYAWKGIEDINRPFVRGETPPTPGRGAKP
jgi:phytanoyl-CoA hydroxylase